MASPSTTSSPQKPRSPRQAMGSMWLLTRSTPGAADTALLGPWVDRPRYPSAGSRSATTGAMRFHGGTSTGRARCPNSFEIRARPRARSAAMSSTARRAGNSHFFSPAAAWLRWRRPCTRIAMPASPQVRSASSTVAGAGITARDSGTPQRPEIASRRSRTGVAETASSSRHHRVAVRPASAQASSSARRSSQAFRIALPAPRPSRR